MARKRRSTRSLARRARSSGRQLLQALAIAALILVVWLIAGRPGLDMGPLANATPTPARGATRAATALPTRDPNAPTSAPLTTNLPTPENPEIARVVRVVDGDTIVVEAGGVEYTVRYIGVDTPETVAPNRPVEFMGPEASAKNKELVEGQTVRMEKDVSETDRFGRLLRYVWVGDTFVNAELVRQGFAHALSFPPDVKHIELFRALEREARDEGRGLWSESAGEDRPTPAPGAADATPAATPAGDGVVLRDIVYDGIVPRTEADEYVELINRGARPVDLAGWQLSNTRGTTFTFPRVTLDPGETLRVYTNEVHRESGGLSFGSTSAVWSNSGDCGFLVDSKQEVVSQFCYGDEG